MLRKWIMCLVPVGVTYALPAQNRVLEVDMPADKAMVLLYRAPDTDWSRAYRISLNGSEAVRLSKKEVDTLYVSPGMHQLRAKTFGINAGQYWLEAKSGETYHCRVQDRVAPRRLRHELEIIEVHPRTFARETGKK